MAYTDWNVVAFEQPTAAKWNQLGDNDAGLHDGSLLPTVESDGTTVLTNETRANAAYGDLSGGATGPAVTVDIGATGLALVLYKCWFAENNVEQRMAYVASGANTISAHDDKSIGKGAINASPGGANTAFGGFDFLEGLTPGATTFTAKYRTDGASGAFLRRYLAVVTF